MTFNSPTKLLISRILLGTSMGLLFTASILQGVALMVGVSESKFLLTVLSMGIALGVGSYVLYFSVKNRIFTSAALVA